MSNKRQATSDLNHDNWDRQEEPEERGTFRTANDDELKNRVIKKAKRKIVPCGFSRSDTADGSSTTKSVFSTFSGFGKSDTTASSTSSSPFSFLSKIPAVASCASVTTGSVSSSTTQIGGTPSSSLGSGLAASSGIAKATVSSNLTSIPTFSFGNASSTTLETTTSATASQSAPLSSCHCLEYYKKLSSLNKAVSQWITTHVNKNPICILSPIFTDYENYLKEIEDEKKIGEAKVSTSKVFGEAKETSPESGSFKMSTSSTASSINNVAVSTSAETVGKTNGFSFGLKKTDDKIQDHKPATATFNFNLASTTTVSSNAAPVTGFSFGNITNNTNTSGTPQKPFQFSFANIKPPAADTASISGPECNEDEDEKPPKNEFKQVVENDAVYSKKCKIFVKKDGNFVDKGVGTMYLKPVESTNKTQLLVRADTNLGNILVNLILNDAIPTQRMGKNNVMMVCLPTPDVEKPTSLLMRVKTSEEADELLENIDKYKK